jgi:hypothetical protein
LSSGFDFAGNNRVEPFALFLETEVKGRFSMPLLLKLWPEWLKDKVPIFDCKIVFLSKLMFPLEVSDDGTMKVEIGFKKDGSLKEELADVCPSFDSLVPVEWRFSYFVESVINGTIDVDNVKSFKHFMKQDMDKLLRKYHKKMDRHQRKPEKQEKPEYTPKVILPGQEDASSPPRPGPMFGKNSIVPAYIANLKFAYDAEKTIVTPSDSNKKQIASLSSKALSETFKIYYEAGCVKKVIFDVDKLREYHLDEHPPTGGPSTAGAIIWKYSALEKIAKQSGTPGKESPQKSRTVVTTRSRTRASTGPESAQKPAAAKTPQKTLTREEAAKGKSRSQAAKASGNESSKKKAPSVGQATAKTPEKTLTREEAAKGKPRSHAAKASGNESSKKKAASVGQVSTGNEAVKKKPAAVSPVVKRPTTNQKLKDPPPAEVPKVAALPMANVPSNTKGSTKPTPKPSLKDPPSTVMNAAATVVRKANTNQKLKDPPRTNIQFAGYQPTVKNPQPAAKASTAAKKPSVSTAKKPAQTKRRASGSGARASPAKRIKISSEHTPNGTRRSNRLSGSKYESWDEESKKFGFDLSLIRFGPKDTPAGLKEDVGSKEDEPTDLQPDPIDPLTARVPRKSGKTSTVADKSSAPVTGTIEILSENSQADDSKGNSDTDTTKGSDVLDGDLI